jgi:hypothetical protein
VLALIWLLLLMRVMPSLRCALCLTAAAVQVALQRLNPGRDFDENIVFRGWSKMATPLTSFRITQVGCLRRLLATEMRAVPATACISQGGCMLHGLKTCLPRRASHDCCTH